MNLNTIVAEFLAAGYYTRKGTRMEYRYLKDDFGGWLQKVYGNANDVEELRYHLPEDYPLVERKGKDETYVLNILKKPQEAINWVDSIQNEFRIKTEAWIEIQLTLLHKYGHLFKQAEYDICTCKKTGDMGCPRCEDMRHWFNMIKEIERKCNVHS